MKREARVSSWRAIKLILNRPTNVEHASLLNERDGHKNNKATKLKLLVLEIIQEKEQHWKKRYKNIALYRTVLAV